MRAAMCDYVRAIHAAYLDAAAPLPPAEYARLPLIAATDLTIIAVGTRNLHVLGTTQTLAAPVDPEVELTDATGPLTWRIRFFDPVVAPALGLIDESTSAQPEQVRDVLGVRTVVYHLTVPPGGGLSAHHALHAGTGLAHSHAAAHRDFDSIVALVPQLAALVAEMRGAEVAGLLSAQVLIARAINPDSVVLAQLPVAPADSQQVRRMLLASLRERA
jgi:hypothetical protein